MWSCFFGFGGVFCTNCSSLDDVNGSSTSLTTVHLCSVCEPLFGFYQHDKKHGSQLLGEECSTVCSRGLEHCWLLQLHQRLSVPCTPGQRYMTGCCMIAHVCWCSMLTFLLLFSYHPTGRSVHSSHAELASYVIILHPKASKPRKRQQRWETNVQGKGKTQRKGGVIMCQNLHRGWKFTK